MEVAQSNMRVDIIRVAMFENMFPAALAFTVSERLLCLAHKDPYILALLVGSLFKHLLVQINGFPGLPSGLLDDAQAKVG